MAEVGCLNDGKIAGAERPNGIGEDAVDEAIVKVLPVGMAFVLSNLGSVV